MKQNPPNTLTASQLWDHVSANHVPRPEIRAAWDRILKAWEIESKAIREIYDAVLDKSKAPPRVLAAKPNLKKLKVQHPHQSHPAIRKYPAHAIFHKQRALYSPCDCGSGKLLKFCCRAEVQARIEGKAERPLRSVRWNSDTGMPPHHRGSTNMKTRAAKLDLWISSTTYMNEGAAVRRKLRAEQPAGEAKGGRRQRRKARAKAAREIANSRETETAF